jgi:hypothetical protein
MTVRETFTYLKVCTFDAVICVGNQNFWEDLYELYLMVKALVLTHDGKVSSRG